MSQADAGVIRNSVRTLPLRFDQVAERFFTSLFEAAPDLRAKLPSDTTEQRSILAVKLNWLADNGHDMNAIRDQLGGLGARLASYGVDPERLHGLREALVRSMGQCAGDGWTAEFEDAWTRVLYTACALMLRGAESKAA